MTFDQFTARIDELANGDGYEGSYVAATGESCWRESFDDGMSPDDAWSEECYAAAQMIG